MDNMESIKTQYEAYTELFRHYSSMIYKARVSIITVIVLSFWFILDFAPKDQNLKMNELTKLLMPVLSSTLIAFLFLLEVSYDKLAFRAIRCLKALEKDHSHSFFGIYGRTHWHFSILYLLSCVMFSALSWMSWNELTIHVHWFHVCATWLGIIGIPILHCWFWSILNKSYFYYVWNIDLNTRGVLLACIMRYREPEDLRAYEKKKVK